MNVSVLIPWRTDNGHRARVFAHIRELWAQLPVQLVIGADSETETPFNVARAFNDAARHATGDVFVLFGADQLPDLDAVHAAAAHALEHDSWAPLFASTGAYRELDTDLILKGADPARYDFSQWAPFCTGILAVSRGAWSRVNGMDERFFGWGCERRSSTHGSREHRGLFGASPHRHTSVPLAPRRPTRSLQRERCHDRRLRDSCGVGP